MTFFQVCDINRKTNPTTTVHCFFLDLFPRLQIHLFFRVVLDCCFIFSSFSYVNHVILIVGFFKIFQQMIDKKTMCISVRYGHLETEGIVVGLKKNVDGKSNLSFLWKTFWFILCIRRLWFTVFNYLSGITSLIEKLLYLHWFRCEIISNSSHVSFSDKKPT